MTTHNTAELKAEIARHVANDGALLIFGKYYDVTTGAACFIGCAAKSSDPAIVMKNYGIPGPVMRIGEAIHEGFGERNKPAAIAFFSAFGEALRDGIDLSRFHWRYTHEMLLAIQPTGDEAVDASVVESAEIMRLLADGADPATLHDRAWAWAAAAEAAAWAATKAAEAAWAAAAEAATWGGGSVTPDYANSWSNQAARFIRILRETGETA